MAKPSNVGQWDSTLVNVVEPTGEKTVGWAPGQIPTAQVFNWFQNTSYLWHKYLNDDTMGAGGIVDTLLTRTITDANPYINITNAGAGAAIKGTGTGSYGVWGRSNGTSVFGDGGTIGCYGDGSTTGVRGASSVGVGVTGDGAGGGVYGTCGVAGFGVKGINTSTSASGTKYGCFGQSIAGTGTSFCVGSYGEGSSYGVQGVSATGVGGFFTGVGTGNSGVVGIYNTDVGMSYEAAGVQGYGDTKWGGVFSGAMGGVKAVGLSGSYALTTSSSGNAISCDGHIAMTGGNIASGTSITNQVVANNLVKAYGIVSIDASGVVTISGGFNIGAITPIPNPAGRVQIDLLGNMSDEVSVVTANWTSLPTWVNPDTLYGRVTAGSGGATLDFFARDVATGNLIDWFGAARSFQFMVVGRQ